MEVVESLPPRRKERRSSVRWDIADYFNCKIGCFTLTGLAGLAVALIVQAVTARVETTILAGFWRVVSPWLYGTGMTGFLICMAVVAWQIRLVQLAHREKVAKVGLLEENLSVSRQVSRMLTRADRQNDNWKVTYDDETGQTKRIEVVRSSVLLEQ